MKNEQCCQQMKAMPQFEHRVDIVFDQPTGENGPTGEAITTEVVFFRTRANLVPLRPRQDIQSDQQTGTLRYQVRFPFSRKGMSITHEMKLRVRSRAFPFVGDMEIDGPPANEEGASRIIRLYAVQIQKGTV